MTGLSAVVERLVRWLAHEPTGPTCDICTEVVDEVKRFDNYLACVPCWWSLARLEVHCDQAMAIANDRQQAIEETDAEFQRNRAPRKDPK